MPTYHSTIWTHKQVKALLKGAGIDPSTVALSRVEPNPARTKGAVVLKGNKITIFCSDIVVKGFLV